MRCRDLSTGGNDGVAATVPNKVNILVVPPDYPPITSSARPSVGTLWPPNHRMVRVRIAGVRDPSRPVQITIIGVTQDEPTRGLGGGDVPVDAVIRNDGSVLLRAERRPSGNGRVYVVHFQATDSNGATASGSVKVSVPVRAGTSAVDDGQNYNSLN